MTTKICLECGKEFNAKYNRAVTCSASCQLQRRNRKQKETQRNYNNRKKGYNAKQRLDTASLNYTECFKPKPAKKPIHNKSLTIKNIVKLATKAGMSYGQYVAQNNL